MPIAKCFLHLFTVLLVSGCITFSYGTQDRFEFTATYYMNGECQVVLPNRDGVYVFEGMSLTEDSGPVKYNDKTYEYSEYTKYRLDCVKDSRKDYRKGFVGSGIASAKLTLELYDIGSIQYDSENSVQFKHQIQWGERILDDPKLFRFIQGYEDIIIPSVSERLKSGSGGFNNKFAKVGVRPNYMTIFKMDFGWHGKYGKQLPGVTRNSCTGLFSATDVSATIYGRRKAAETGVYAEVVGRNATTSQNWCK